MTREPAPAAVAADERLAVVRVAGYRSARDVVLRPGALCALVGEGDVGKSNVLSALWTLLEPHAPALSRADVSAGPDGEVRLSAILASGRTLELRARPPAAAVRRGTGPPAVFLPAALRSTTLVAAPPTARTPAARRFATAVRAAGAAPVSAGAPATGLVAALEAACAAGLAGLTLLVEEPELFLPPQAQRHLYRLLRTFAEHGNQVLYSTHAPAFLNVARLEELVLVRRDPVLGTKVAQPPALPADDSFRALSEFDAERSELFLARAVLLVEGLTEKLVFPFVFRALGYDADAEAISIVECGGKPNLRFFARVCVTAGVPFLVVHDRDAPVGRTPKRAERELNASIAATAGTGRVIELVPDFEGVAGLRGRAHKPAHAWRAFAGASAADVPRPLADAVRAVVELARG